MLSAASASRERPLAGRWYRDLREPVTLGYRAFRAPWLKVPANRWFPVAGAATDVTCRFFLPRRPAGGLSVLAAGQRTRQGVAVCWNRDSCRPPAETGPDPRNTAAGDLPAEAGRS